MDTLTPDQIARDPDVITEKAMLGNGQRFIFRVLRPDDGLLLGRYFEGLSQATRALYGPHPLTMEYGLKLCAEINYHQTLRLVAATDDDKPEIVAYFILVLGIGEGERKRYAGYGIALDSQRDCTLAPSVADAYQNRGLGSALMGFVIRLARRLGKQRMVLMGGTRAINHRAIHFYEKHGFRRVGDFIDNGNNHDMILTLTSGEAERAN